MAGMNRLSPLITRRVGPMAAAVPMERDWFSDATEGQRADGLLQDLKLFATGWAGGLVFFATFLG